MSLFYRETFGYERIFSRHQCVDKTSCKNQYVLTDIGMISYRRYQTLTFIVRFIDIYVWWQLWLVLRIESIIDALGVVRGPVQFTFARSINPIFSKSNSLTRCCITKESDESKNNTFGNKYTVSYGLYRMHGFISASDAAKTGFSEEDKELLFQALINAFENDHSAARGEMNPRALIVFKHDSPLGNARAGQLFDLIQVKLKEEVEFPRAFGDYDVTVPTQEELDEKYPGVSVEELI